MFRGEDVIIRNTGGRSGRVTEVSPENSALSVLTYRRTKLDADRPRVSAESGGEEISLFVLRGSARISVGKESFELGKRDSLFIPPGHDFTIEKTNGDADLAEAAAPSDAVGPPKAVYYEATLGDPALHLKVGSETYRREVIKVIDQNIEASRLLCGYTLGEPANWTSWSPHEHASSREEIYLYIDMPRPAFGIQMIYEWLDAPQTVAAVFENDVAVITRGYHPNAGIPGYGINFLWMMAALKPNVGRVWEEMTQQPEFAGKYG